MSEKFANAKNGHEVDVLFSDFLETMLYNVNRQIPKEKFRSIDNTPKSLIHLTEEDLKPKSPAVMREELNELIKEARSKIKPVMMPKKLKDDLIHTKDESDDWNIINIDSRGMRLLDTEQISLEVLRKI